ncbi:unnamed protein product, partial [Staurois parvus]
MGSSALSLCPPLPIKDWHLWEWGGSGYSNLTGTRSHFRCDRLGDWKRKLSSPLPPRSLLGHVTGPKRLRAIHKAQLRACAVEAAAARWAPMAA